MAYEPKAEKKLSKPQHAIRKDGLESRPPFSPPNYDISVNKFSFLFCNYRI